MVGMPLGPATAAAIVIASSVAFGTRLASAPTALSPLAAAVATASLTILSLAAIAGLLLARGRWARWTCIGLPLGWLVVGIVDGLAAPWIIAGVAAGIGVAVAAGPGSRGWVRTLPSTHGAPPAATVLLLSLLAFPVAVALVDHSALSTLSLVAVASSVLAALLYSRGGVAMVFAMRVLVVVAAVTAFLGAPFPGSVLVAVVGISMTGLTWARSVMNAAAPVIPVAGSGYRIPAELAPGDILNAAGLDEHGRKR
jgi:hypothetical protein